MLAIITELLVISVTQSLGIAGEDQFIENKNTKQKSYKSNDLAVLCCRRNAPQEIALCRRWKSDLRERGRKKTTYPEGTTRGGRVGVGPNTDGRGSVDAEQTGDLNSPFGTIEDPSPVKLGSCLQHQFNPRSGDMESPLLRR